MKVCEFFSDKLCYHSSCSIFDFVSGNVFVCPPHPNPSGFALRRKEGIVFG